jgi:hypothetical protein
MEGRSSGSPDGDRPRFHWPARFRAAEAQPLGAAKWAVFRRIAPGAWRAPWPRRERIPAPQARSGPGRPVLCNSFFLSAKIERYPLPQPLAGAEGHTLAYTTTVVGGPTDLRAECCPPPTHCGRLNAAHEAASRIFFARIFNHLSLIRATHPPWLARRWHYRSASTSSKLFKPTQQLTL